MNSATVEAGRSISAAAGADFGARVSTQCYTDGGTEISTHCYTDTRAGNFSFFLRLRRVFLKMHTMLHEMVL